MKKFYIGLFVIGILFFLVVVIRPTRSHAPVETNTSENEIPTLSTTTPSGETFTMDMVRTHDGEESCYTVVDGKVYDVTSAITNHHGGKFAILKMCGIDATELFTNKHGKSERAQDDLADLYIGDLE